MVKNEKGLTVDELLDQALVPEGEHPYKVPENWYWTKLGSATSIVGGGTPSTSCNEYYENGDIPWLSPADLSGYKEKYISRGNKNITKLGLEKSSAKLMPKGTVVLSSRAPIGYVAIANNELCTNQGFKNFLPSKIFIPEYLYYYLIYLDKQLEEYASGTTFLELSAKRASEIVFPLPPLEEQKRIVKQIEILFEKLNTAIELIETIKDTAEDRKMSYLSKAFSGTLSAEWRDKNNISLNSWGNFKIDDICDVKGGKRVPKGMELTNENTGHPYIRAGNLKNGTVISDKMMYVQDEVLSYIKNYTVSKGDVYITNVGACIGDCGIIPEEYDGANLTENAVKLTNLQCNGKFLAYYLASSKVQQIIKGLIASATLGKLSINNIKSIDIKLPSIEEQEFIVSILNNLLEKENLLNECTDVIDEINIIKKVILSKAFQGNLSTTDLSEESSLELLNLLLRNDLK